MFCGRIVSVQAIGSRWHISETYTNKVIAELASILILPIKFLEYKPNHSQPTSIIHNYCSKHISPNTSCDSHFLC